jgi:hypothetical protein
MVKFDRAAVPAAVSGLLVCGLLFAVAWHRGVGVCNTAAADNGTAGLLRAALVIAIADLALCVASWRPLRDTDTQRWMLLTGLTCATLGVAVFALLVGVNFRGC